MWGGRGRGISKRRDRVRKRKIREGRMGREEGHFFGVHGPHVVFEDHFFGV
jgi:hypothetical protein